MIISEHVSLKALNTFAIESEARYFAAFDSIRSLQALLTCEAWQRGPQFILGGGSNILLPQVYPGMVLKNEIRGIEKRHETDEHVWLTIGAGERWHPLVLHCLEHQYAGVENLSLIPGTVGAAPIQNIGAYGVELKDVFDSLTAVHVLDGSVRRFDLDECQFGYRESIFKASLKGEYIICQVTLRLHKNPIFHVDYGALQSQLAEMKVTALSIHEISRAVIHLRQSKLPDPKHFPNAGSFFKNPSITAVNFEKLKLKHPNIPFFTQKDGTFKIPAAWLIEQMGWKGKRLGRVGVYPQQALVLVNYDQGESDDIHALATRIQQDVQSEFNIMLEMEVQMIK